MRFAFAACVALLSTMPPTAAIAQATLPQDKICIKGEDVVDRDALAEHLVRSFPINVVALPEAVLAGPRSEMPRRLLANPNTCASGDACSPTDIRNLEDAWGTV